MAKKIELINKIEATGMMVNFDRQALMSRSESYLEWAYGRCLACLDYCEKHQIF